MDILGQREHREKQTESRERTQNTERTRREHRENTERTGRELREQREQRERRTQRELRENKEPRKSTERTERERRANAEHRENTERTKKPERTHRERRENAERTLREDRGVGGGGRKEGSEEGLFCSNEKKLCTLLDLCVSSLRRGHANLLCIVPILTDDPRRVSDTDDSEQIPFCKKNADNEYPSGWNAHCCVVDYSSGPTHELQLSTPTRPDFSYLTKIMVCQVPSV